MTPVVLFSRAVLFGIQCLGAALRAVGMLLLFVLVFLGIGLVSLYHAVERMAGRKSG